jgi:HSP20 family molecular chaperone IbpA
MSTLTLWGRRDPFAEFDALYRAAFAPGFARTAGFTPAAEVTRDGDDALIRLELPGVDAERDITVEVDRGTLVVRGDRRDEKSDERAGRVLREVRYGAFRRAFALPGHVTGDDLTATYDAGVLTVRVGGAYAGSTARRIPVTGAHPVAVDTAPAGDEQAAA